jgi:hypothetical protein
VALSGRELDLILYSDEPILEASYADRLDLAPDAYLRAGYPEVPSCSLFGSASMPTPMRTVSPALAAPLTGRSTETVLV